MTLGEALVDCGNDFDVRKAFKGVLLKSKITAWVEAAVEKLRPKHAMWHRGWKHADPTNEEIYGIWVKEAFDRHSRGELFPSRSNGIVLEMDYAEEEVDPAEFQPGTEDVANVLQDEGDGDENDEDELQDEEIDRTLAIDAPIEQQVVAMGEDAVGTTIAPMEQQVVPSASSSSDPTPAPIVTAEDRRSALLRRMQALRIVYGEKPPKP